MVNIFWKCRLYWSRSELAELEVASIWRTLSTRASSLHSSEPGALLPSSSLARRSIWFGPAFVASIAYIDPGNFGTNFIAGTGFGYKLLWVLLWSNVMAILIQYLSAKLGIATGATLPQNCREHSRAPRRSAFGWLPNCRRWPPTWRSFWARRWASTCCCGGYFLGITGLAKTCVMFLPVVSAICVFAILALELRVSAALEIGIMVFVLVIGVCYLVEIFLSSTRLGHDRLSYRSTLAGSPEHLRGGQHAGRDGDAARRVSAFRPGAAAGAGRRTALSAIEVRYVGCGTFGWRRWMCLRP